MFCITSISNYIYFYLNAGFIDVPIYLIKIKSNLKFSMKVLKKVKKYDK